VTWYCPGSTVPAGAAVALNSGTGIRSGNHWLRLAITPASFCPA